MTIGAHYSPVLAMLQAATKTISGTQATTAAVPAASAPPATPMDAVLLGPAALGTEFRLGQTVDAQA